jgi:hypothetical protein
VAYKKGQLKPEGSGRKSGQCNGDISKIRQLVVMALDEAGGVKYLTAQAKENPAAFLALLGKVIPKEIDAKILLDAKVETFTEIRLVAFEEQSGS